MRQLTRWRRSPFRSPSAPAALVAAVGALVPAIALALDATRSPAPLAARAFSRPELTLSITHIPAGSRESAAYLPPRARAWSALLNITGPSASIYLDPRSGIPASIIAAVPMVPGDGVGNTLTLASVGTSLGRPASAVDSALVAEAVRRFVSRHAAGVGVDDAQVGA